MESGRYSLLSLIVGILSGCNFSLIEEKFAIHFQHFSPVQEMVIPLETTFSTDEQVVVQGDITFMGKTVESLVMQFDQAKYDVFLSSGSKSPRVVRQYRRVSLEIRSQVSSELSKDGPPKQRHF